MPQRRSEPSGEDDLDHGAWREHNYRAELYLVRRWVGDYIVIIFERAKTWHGWWLGVQADLHTLLEIVGEMVFGQRRLLIRVFFFMEMR